MFVVSLNYIKPIEEVDRHLSAHVAYLKDQYAAGHFLASGRKIPRTGGVILAISSSREILERILSEDPFNINGMAEYEVIEFLPGMTCTALDFLNGK